MSAATDAAGVLARRRSRSAPCRCTWLPASGARSRSACSRPASTAMPTPTGVDVERDRQRPVLRRRRRTARRAGDRQRARSSRRRSRGVVLMYAVKATGTLRVSARGRTRRPRPARARRGRVSGVRRDRRRGRNGDVREDGEGRDRLRDGAPANSRFAARHAAMGRRAGTSPAWRLSRSDISVPAFGASYRVVTAKAVPPWRRHRLDLPFH